jgi:hypothetical protein
MARPGDTRRERYPELDPTRPEPVPLGAGAVRFSSRAGRRPWTSRSIPAGKLSVATGSRLVLQPAQVADKPQALDRVRSDARAATTSCSADRNCRGSSVRTRLSTVDTRRSRTR